MPYNHQHGRDIISVDREGGDIEPALESHDPHADKALDHLIIDHPDLFKIFEKIASDLSEENAHIKVVVLKGMARAIGYLEQRPSSA